MNSALNIKLEIIYLLSVLTISNAFSQLSISNQLQYQLGNMPDVKPANRTALFDQLNINYYFQNIQIGGRLEFFQIANRDQEYAAIQQKYVQYQNNNLTLKLGNFYESLGQGVLLRTYEIPGIVYEDPGSRQQYGFYKDIEGAILKYYSHWLNVKVLYGRPLDLLQPPVRNYEIRRPYLIQGGEINMIYFNAFSPGIIYLRSNQQQTENEFAGINIGGNFPFGLQYYFEYDQNIKENETYFEFGSSGRHGFYGSLSQSIDWLSLSCEVKDYNNFSLNFNDPPSLVREQSRTLLNRGTHAIQPLNERGIQIEGIFNIGNLNTITANHAYAENKFSGNLTIFREYYLDLNYYLTISTLTKFFIDHSEDQLVNVIDRRTVGTLLDQQLPGQWGGIIDLQFQKFRREYDSGSPFNHSVINYLIDLSFSHSPNISFGINIEAAHDPLESNTLLELDNTRYKYWIGGTVSYNYDQNNTVNLFYGKRRGGNACSGGICYEVQPFEGFELKLNSVL